MASKGSRWGKLTQQPVKLRVLMALMTVLIIVFALVLIRPMERSIASYCKVYSKEKTRLARLPGDTYPSGVFDNALSDAGEFAKSYGKLERVSPVEISTDLENLKNIYSQMDKDPTKAISAAFAAIGPDDTIKKWTAEHCKE